MEISSHIPFTGRLKRSLRRRQYQRLDGSTSTSTTKRNVKITSFQGTNKKNNRRFWKIRAIPKLRFKIKIVWSPIKLLARLRDAYVDMMLGLTGNVGDATLFGNKRIPKARQVERVSKAEEFEMKLIVEIYKSLVASRRSTSGESFQRES